MEDTAIVVRDTKPAAIAQYGDRESLELLGNRIAMFFGIGDTKQGQARDEEIKAARPACLKAAQLTYQYGLVPGMDVYVIKRGKAYSAEPSLQMWQKMADRHAFVGKFRFTVDVEELTPAEVAERTDPDVKASPEDRGARARVLRLDLAREMKDLGLPYRPTWHYGFWRKNAREETVWDDASRTKVRTGNYEADQVPAQRTRQDVAVRRATRAALMAAFPMIPVDDFQERYQSAERAAEIRLAQAMRFIDSELAERARIERDEDDPIVNATFVEKPVQYEEDGNVLWATEPQRQATITVQATPVVEPPAAKPANGNGNGHAPAQATLDAKTLRHLHVVGGSLYGQDWDAKRKEIVKAATKGRTDSSKELRQAEADYLIERMEAKLQQQLDAISMADAAEIPGGEAVPA
jgi:hypothetical protein